MGDAAGMEDASVQLKYDPPDSVSAIECVVQEAVYSDNDNNTQQHISTTKTAIHMNYDEEGMLQCPQCNFKTHMPKQFESHLACHTRLRDQMFQCDICHMKFSQKANMNRHRMRHSGYKPYQCSVCSKRFFRRDHMRTHEITHYDSAGRRFGCPLCDNVYTRLAILRHHLDNDHPFGPQAPAACKVCTVAFNSASRLLTHFQTEHESFKDDSGDSCVTLGGPNYEAAMEFRSSLAQMVASSLTEGDQGASIPVMQAFDGQQQAGAIERDDSYQFDNSNEETEPKAASSHNSTPTKLMQNLRSPTLELFPSSESPSLDGRNSAHVDAVVSRFNGNAERSCNFCEIQFNDRTLYFLHKGLHAESDPWKCNLCGENCGDKYTFHTHLIGAKHS